MLTSILFTTKQFCCCHTCQMFTYYIWIQNIFLFQIASFWQLNSKHLIYTIFLCYALQVRLTVVCRICLNHFSWVTLTNSFIRQQSITHQVIQQNAEITVLIFKTAKAESPEVLIANRHSMSCMKVHNYALSNAATVEGKYETLVNVCLQ